MPARTRKPSSPPITTGVDMVNHPPHYSAHPKGIECIDVVEEAGFRLGNAIKYLYRVAFGGKTGSNSIEDLRKAIWYIEREIQTREGE